MGYQTKVQLIERKQGVNQWYINFPTPIAEAMGFQKGEIVEWSIEDRTHLLLSRPHAPASKRAKKQNQNP